MNVAAANTPPAQASPSPAEVLPPMTDNEPGNEDDVAENHADVPKQDDTLSPEEEQDEEIRLAMEMAMAAAQNPNLSPDELRKLVQGKNKQLDIVTEVEQVKQKELQERQQKEKQEAQERWEHKKENAWAWWNKKRAAVASKAEGLVFEAEKQYYAEEIKKDPQIIAIRKQMKICKKTLKAHKLQGNRVETRHTFKRRRMEKNLMDLRRKLRKQQHQLTHSSYGVHEYAKAMMRASRKWRKKGTKEELALEAQLCRNMHQMLAIEKQKAKAKKSHREIKKYLQRCKSWLQDKKAFCEMHMITLDATANSIKFLYEERLAKQDALIRKMLALEEFQGVDLSSVPTPHLDYPLEQAPGPSAMLNALRGLPIRDSVRLTKEEMAKKLSPEPAANAKKPEIFIEAKDDCSVSSNLSDPDGDFEPEQEEPMEDEGGDSDSDGGFNFGKDAPWNSNQNSDSNLSGDAKPAAKMTAPAVQEADALVQNDDKNVVSARSSEGSQVGKKKSMNVNTTKDKDASPDTHEASVDAKDGSMSVEEKPAVEETEVGDEKKKDKEQVEEPAAKESSKKIPSEMEPAASPGTAVVDVSEGESTLDGGDIVSPPTPSRAKATPLDYSTDTMHYISDPSDDEVGDIEGEKREAE